MIALAGDEYGGDDDEPEAEGSSDVGEALRGPRVDTAQQEYSGRWVKSKRAKAHYR